MSLKQGKVILCKPYFKKSIRMMCNSKWIQSPCSQSYYMLWSFLDPTEGVWLCTQTLLVNWIKSYLVLSLHAKYCMEYHKALAQFKPTKISCFVSIFPVGGFSGSLHKCIQSQSYWQKKYKVVREKTDWPFVKRFQQLPHGSYFFGGSNVLVGRSNCETYGSFVLAKS